MITLTIKGIPKSTHRELKKRAAVNRRSLNNEIIFTLETLLGGGPQEVVRFSQHPKPIKKTSSRK
jgi:plasmid stability protein